MGKWLKSPQTLIFEAREKVAYITFNRPEKRNAQSVAALHHLQIEHQGNALLLIPTPPRR